jgi:hypothetical protein
VHPTDTRVHKITGALVTYSWISWCREGQDVHQELHDTTQHIRKASRSMADCMYSLGLCTGNTSRRPPDPAGPTCISNPAILLLDRGCNHLQVIECVDVEPQCLTCEGQPKAVALSHAQRWQRC